MSTNFETVMNNYYVAHNLPTYSNKNIVSRGHVFDVKKSVEWNLNEVAKHNAAIEIEEKELKEKRNKAMEKALDEYYNFVAEDLKLSKDDVIHLINYINEDIADDELYSDAYEWLKHICEVIRRNG